jgi:hypothetical protein
MSVVTATALSLKEDGEVNHFLIEANDDGTVQVKDASRSFRSLQDLIFHHCTDADGACVCPSLDLLTITGLPCVLRPDQCFILTSKCPYISSEWYMDRLAKQKPSGFNASQFNENDSDASSAILPPDGTEGLIDT